jgi:imidazolonepropionase-like amidohydrolase
MLYAGFTALRDLGNAGTYGVEDIRKAINSGLFDGPTIISAGKIIAPFGGQTDNIPRETGSIWQVEYLEADTRDELRKAIRTNLYYGADLVKLVADQYAYFYSLDDIRFVVAEAHSAGKPVAVHVFGGEAAQNCIEGGVDVIEHGFELTDEQLELMKEKGTYLVITDFPKEQLERIGMVPNRGEFQHPGDVYDNMVDRLRRAYQIGVKIAFGTDEFLTEPDRDRSALCLDFLDVMRDDAGLPAPFILKSMTTTAAEVLRINDDRGEILTGFAADMVAAPGNPLDDIAVLRDIDFVMKDGKVIRRPGR